MKSMTAYGRHTFSLSKGGRLTIEVASLNGKGLHIDVQAPAESLGMTYELRQIVSRHLKRGSVTVRVTRADHSHSLDLSHLERVKRDAQEVAERLGYGSDALSLRLLLELAAREPLAHEPRESGIEKGTLEALSALDAMQRQEGSLLSRVIGEAFDAAEAALASIERSEGVAEARRLTLMKRLEALGLPDDERVTREVALIAERSDIKEEVDRLKSHIQQGRSLLSEDRPVGLELGFLAQEMLREASTIGAKSYGEEAIRYVIAMKQAIAAIKEQSANVV